MGEIFIGTSGWQYPHWRGVFYPEDLPQKEWLLYYAKYFDTVEVNATFYHQMRKETFKKWRETVGDDFVFSIKGSRFITHIKRLKDCQEELKRFFEAAKAVTFSARPRESNQREGGPSFVAGDSRASGAGAALGNSLASLGQFPFPSDALGQNQHGDFTKGSKNVILWQLPPGMKADLERLKKFLEILPNEWRQAFEFRDKSWLNEKIYELLKDYNCALVIQDSPYWPTAEVVTADFVYLRFHGRQSLYASCYSDSELDFLSKKMKQWLKKGLDVYGYFNNDAQGYAIDNARTLKKFVSRSED